MAFRLTSLRAAATLLAFSSVVACSKKSEDTPAPAATPLMTWTVDGANVTVAAAPVRIFGDKVVIAGVSSATQPISSVQLAMPQRTGTFATTKPITDAYATYTTNAGAASSKDYDATSGTIVVTTYSPSTTTGASNIAGTFTFTGADSTATAATKTITNGTFNVKY